MANEHIIGITIPDDLRKVQEFLQETKNHIFQIVSYVGDQQELRGLDNFFTEIAEETKISKEEIRLMHNRCMTTSKEYQMKGMFAQPAIKKDVNIDTFCPTYIACKEDIIDMLHTLTDTASKDFFFVHEALRMLLEKCKMNNTTLRVLFEEITLYERDLLLKINKVLTSANKQRSEHLLTDGFKHGLEGLKFYDRRNEEVLPERLTQEVKDMRPRLAEGIILHHIGERKKADELLQGIPIDIIEKSRNYMFNVLEVQRWDDFLEEFFDPLYCTIVYQSEIVEMRLQICIIKKLDEFMRQCKTLRLLPHRSHPEEYFSVKDLYKELGRGEKYETTIEEGSTLGNWISEEKRFYVGFFKDLKEHMEQEHPGSRMDNMRKDLEKEKAEKEQEKAKRKEAGEIEF